MSWDTVWEDVFVRQREWGKYPGESLIQFVARNFYRGNRRKTRILEVGCGPGPNIWYMAREGFDAYGIDGSKTAIQDARSRLSREGLKAHLQVGDIVKLPYREDFFDAVVDVECVYSNPARESGLIIKEIHRVLKPGGLFYSRTVADDIYLGKKHKKLGKFEYTDVSDGAFAGKGFLRLIDRKGIKDLYGKVFNLRSIDKLRYSYNNGAVTVSEWVIVSQKAA